jgi:hypothetical protein
MLVQGLSTLTMHVFGWQSNIILSASLVGRHGWKKGLRHLLVHSGATTVQTVNEFHVVLLVHFLVVTRVCYQQFRTILCPAESE